MKKNLRFNKWQKYRQDIDSVEMLDFSIINSDNNLKELFSSIDFNIENAYIRFGFKTNNFKNDHYKSSKIIHRQEINQILNTIEKNENFNANSDMSNIFSISDFNSHNNDKLINEFFKEFIDKRELEEQENQETTDLKINKINILESKEK